MDKKTDQVLEERGAKYGDFRVQFQFAQKLKCAIDTALIDAGNLELDPVLNEASDLICTKLSRMANGDSMEPDTWRDIAGYATLAAIYCEEQQENKNGTK